LSKNHFKNTKNSLVFIIAMIVISLVLGNGKTPDKFYKEIKDFEKT
jgi:hypothetical protein